MIPEKIRNLYHLIEQKRFYDFTEQFQLETGTLDACAELNLDHRGEGEVINLVREFIVGLNAVENGHKSLEVFFKLHDAKIFLGLTHEMHYSLPCVFNHPGYFSLNAEVYRVVTKKILKDAASSKFKDYKQLSDAMMRAANANTEAPKLKAWVVRKQACTDLLRHAITSREQARQRLHNIYLQIKEYRKKIFELETQIAALENLEMKNIREIAELREQSRKLNKEIAIYKIHLKRQRDALGWVEEKNALRESLEKHSARLEVIIEECGFSDDELYNFLIVASDFFSKRAQELYKKKPITQKDIDLLEQQLQEAEGDIISAKKDLQEKNEVAKKTQKKEVLSKRLHTLRDKELATEEEKDLLEKMLRDTTREAHETLSILYEKFYGKEHSLFKKLLFNRSFDDVNKYSFMRDLPSCTEVAVDVEFALKRYTSFEQKENYISRLYLHILKLYDEFNAVKFQKQQKEVLELLEVLYGAMLYNDHSDTESRTILSASTNVVEKYKRVPLSYEFVQRDLRNMRQLNWLQRKKYLDDFREYILGLQTHYEFTRCLFNLEKEPEVFQQHRYDLLHLVCDEYVTLLKDPREKHFKIEWYETIDEFSQKRVQFVYSKWEVTANFVLTDLEALDKSDFSPYRKERYALAVVKYIVNSKKHYDTQSSNMEALRTTEKRNTVNLLMQYRVKLLQTPDAALGFSRDYITDVKAKYSEWPLSPDFMFADLEKVKKEVSADEYKQYVYDLERYVANLQQKNDLGAKYTLKSFDARKAHSLTYIKEAVNKFERELQVECKKEAKEKPSPRFILVGIIDCLLELIKRIFSTTSH